ncbi:MAG: electron transfer flavoprotein subunit beta/FixA family protein [Thermoleophilia bacterium]
MDIVVAMQQTVDLVEELELNDDGTDVEREYLKFVANEWDEQALEEALLLKEATGATVTVVGIDETDVDGTLYAALAKGADRAVKLTGDFEDGVSSHRRAAILAAWLGDQRFDLVLAGVQSPEDLDGQTGVILANLLDIAHVSVAIGVQPHDGGVKVSQEFGGGVVHELALSGRAVVGIQAARQAPRYVSISRVRAAMQEGAIDELPAPEVDAPTGTTVRRLYAPESTSHAEMLEGDADEVAARIIEIVRERGLVKGGS